MIGKNMNEKVYCYETERPVYTRKKKFWFTKKLNRFFDAEYKVIGLEEGKKKMLNNGIMEGNSMC